MNHSPFLDCFRKLAAIFATLGRFEEAYCNFPTLKEQLKHCQSLFIIAMHISIFQSLLFENEAYNIFRYVWMFAIAVSWAMFRYVDLRLMS